MSVSPSLMPSRSLSGVEPATGERRAERPDPDLVDPDRERLARIDPGPGRPEDELLDRHELVGAGPGELVEREVRLDGEPGAAEDGVLEGLDGDPIERRRGEGAGPLASGLREVARQHGDGDRRVQVVLLDQVHALAVEHALDLKGCPASTGAPTRNPPSPQGGRRPSPRGSPRRSWPTRGQPHGAATRPRRTRRGPVGRELGIALEESDPLLAGELLLPRDELAHLIAGRGARGPRS